MLEKLTEEEQKEYERLQNLEKFGKLSGKVLPESAKVKLEEYRNRIRESINCGELKEYRELWKEKIEYISDDVKEKIVRAVDNIPVKVETDSDGSRLIEFKLGNKRYKILDPRLENHTDEEYRSHVKYSSFIEINKDYVKGGGMMGDNVDEWKNGKLKEYVKEKQREGLHIPKKEEMVVLLNELGEQADLSLEKDKIAMLMYLTGMDGWYWLTMESKDTRSLLICDDATLDFDDFADSLASLCMMSCE